MKEIRLFEPQIGIEERRAVEKVLKSGWLAKGKVTEEFEKQFARYVGADYAIFTNGCTSALKIALRALESPPGDVIVPSYTFTATAAAVVETGHRPVFADISLENLGLRPASVHSKITFRTRAIIPVHYGGVETETKGYEVPVIVDSAHLVKRRGFRPWVKAQCYSFYASKVMTTGAGGMLVTNDKEFYERAKLLNNDGVNKSSLDRYNSAPGYSVLVAGGGYDGTDLAAAIGLEQLKKLPRFEKKRSALVKLYNRELGTRWSGLYLYPIGSNDREGMMAYLKSCGIPTSIFYLPLHLQPAYQDYYSGPLPITEFAGNSQLCLPLHPGLTFEQVRYICGKVKKYR